MAKKVFGIVTSLLLLIASGGWAVSTHYCGGEAVSFTVNAESDPCCDDADCCHDETTFVKIRDHFISVENMGLDEVISLQPEAPLRDQRIDLIPASDAVQSCTPFPRPPLLSHSRAFTQSFLL